MNGYYYDDDDREFNLKKLNPLDLVKPQLPHQVLGTIIDSQRKKNSPPPRRPSSVPTRDLGPRTSGPARIDDDIIRTRIKLDDLKKRNDFFTDVSQLRHDDQDRRIENHLWTSSASGLIDVVKDTFKLNPTASAVLTMLPIVLSRRTRRVNSFKGFITDPRVLASLIAVIISLFGKRGLSRVKGLWNELQNGGATDADVEAVVNGYKDKPDTMLKEVNEALKNLGIDAVLKYEKKKKPKRKVKPAP